MTTQSQRLLWCDLARATAALLVVLLHVAAKWFESYGRIPSFDWQVANIFDAAARHSVPWFFMLSGFLLLDRRPASFSAYLHRRLSRVLGPFLTFSLVGAAMALAIGPSPPSWNVLLTPTYYHLWFFYPLLLFYLAAFFVTPARINPWLGLAVCYALIALAGGGVASFGVDGQAVRSEHLFAYLLYGIAGFYIGRIPLRRWTGTLSLTVLIAAIATLAVGTAHLSRVSGQPNETLFGYVSLPVAAAAFAGLLWMRALGPVLVRAPAALTGAVGWLSGYSLALYGLHAFVLEAIWRVAGPRLLKAGAMAAIPSLVGLVTVLSLGLAVMVAALDRRGGLMGTPEQARSLRPQPTFRPT
jgi:surface polysaccharide O-acyltransferase-like enzyme